MKIVFMGTPAFAVPSLEMLCKAGFNIVAVITAPDRPAGRGYKPQESEVKKFALANNLSVLQPTNLKAPEFLETLKSLQADLQVVVAFRMLPEAVWNMPPLGTINLHASLLPQYRGAAPINWAIINGETETGITIFKLQHAIDTGNILLQQAIPLTKTDTAGTLHDKLMNAGASLLLEAVAGIQKAELKEIQQAALSNGKEVKHAPKISSEDCEIDWNQSTEHIYNLIRGLSPYPSAFTFLQGKRLKILQAETDFSAVPTDAAGYTTDSKSFLKFRTSDGFISVRRLKPEGKSEMSVEDFLRGKRDL